MKKIIMVLVLCIFVAGSCGLGYCQETVEKSLDTEITSEGNESAPEVAEANVEFDAGEPMSP